MGGAFELGDHTNFYSLRDCAHCHKSLWIKIEFNLEKSGKNPF